MKNAYPIKIQQSGEFYVVYIPDFDANTQGTTIAEAMEMARDAIGMLGCYLQDEKKPIPAPSSLDRVDRQERDIVSLVDIDFDEYRRKHEMRTVRKNEAAEAANVNFSAILQKALKSELHITDR